MALALLCVSLSSACGQEIAAPEERIQAQIDAMRSAFEARDVAGVCALTTAPRCPATIGYLLEHGRASTSPARSGKRDVVEVTVDGRLATAIVTFHDRIPGLLRFRERGDGWKLADVSLSPVEARSSWRWVTATGIESFRSWRMRGSRSVPCPPITSIAHAGMAAVRGGCRFQVANSDLAVLMFTALGDFEVARCAGSHMLHIASNSTAILADRIRFLGPGICGPIQHCEDGETGLRYPWQGSKLRGRFTPPLHMQIDICVNTPLGRARGMLHFQIARNGRSWTATPYDYPIGESSIQFSGSSRMSPGGLETRPRDDF